MQRKLEPSLLEEAVSQFTALVPYQSLENVCHQHYDSDEFTPRSCLAFQEELEQMNYGYWRRWVKILLRVEAEWTVSRDCRDSLWELVCGRGFPALPCLNENLKKSYIFYISWCFLL